MHIDHNVLFSGDYISALMGCCPSKFLHALEIDQCLIAHTTTGALKSQVLENVSTENASTKQDILQGWKLQVLKTQVRFARVENASTENVSTPLNTICGVRLNFTK